MLSGVGRIVIPFAQRILHNIYAQAERAILRCTGFSRSYNPEGGELETYSFVLFPKNYKNVEKRKRRRIKMFLSFSFFLSLGR